MSYPALEADRVKFWLDQIEYARKRIKPLFDACNVLANQYFNEPSTEREMALADLGSGAEEHVRRTKAGIVFGWIDQSLANMLDRSPTFRCLPESREAAARVDAGDPSSPTLAQGTSRIVNYRYRETNQLRVDERVTLDAFLFPYGVAKLGFAVDPDVERQEILQPGVELELDDPEDENLFLATGTQVLVTEFHDHTSHIAAHVALLQGEEIDLTGPAAPAIRDVIADHVALHKRFHNRPAVDANTNVQRGSPFAVRWAPDMFLTDTLSTEGPQDARWIAFGWELPLDEVQANPAFRNTAALRPSRWKDAPERSGAVEHDGFDMVRGWEIWARRFPVGRGKFRDLLLVVAEDQDAFLREEDEWPYTNLDDYPAETLVFQPGIRRWFHKPPLLMGGGDTVQALINEVLDSFLYTIRKQKNIWVVDPITGITGSKLQDILDAPDGSVIEVPGLLEMMKSAGEKGVPVIPLPFHAVPQEKGELLNVLQQMFDRSVGTPQPVQMPRSDTATEASILERRNTARENRRSALLSEFQVRKARKMWQLDTQFQPRRLFLLDKDATKFIQITPEVAKGEFLFTMDVTSHSTALAVERSQWMDLLNLFAGLTPIMMQTFGLPPNLPELARRLLVRGFDERVVEEILPVLEQASQRLQQGTPMEMTGRGSGAEFASPEAQAVQEAVRDGRMVDRGIGPLNREAFNRDLASEGQQLGEGVRG